MTLSDLKILYEVLAQDKEAVQMAIVCIDLGYVTLNEIEQNCFMISNNRMYSEENYVIDYYGNVIDRDCSFYCNGENEFFNDDEGVTVYLYRDENTFSRKYAENNSDWIEYRGDFYNDDGRCYHSIVYVQDQDDYDSEDNAYYHENDGRFYSYPQDEIEDYTRGYHNGEYRTVLFDSKSKYRIGYEIEKEDADVLQSINISDFEDNTNDVWRKERDGSLDDYSGYELISPTFEFDIHKIFEHIEDNATLVEHINADVSTSCGGHIHLSEIGVSGEEMFDRIKGYTPLFYALYHGRVDKNYCKGKNNRDLKDDNEKYQAIKIHHDRVEFRIISAVRNVKTLKWRSKLLMMILQHPTSDIIRAYYNVDTKFTKLLSQVYSDDKLVELKERFVKYTKQFEGLDINDKDNNK